jgi:D-sedoheptulose 7-phosphate isomerase
MHLACDFAKGLSLKGSRRIKVISLADNIPLITAWSNDTNLKNCFQEQLVNLLERGDVLIAISASGNSENVLRAVRYAKAKGAITIGLAGFGGGKLLRIVEIPIRIYSGEYEVVEDVQLCLGHFIKKGLQRIGSKSAKWKKLIPDC